MSEVLRIFLENERGIRRWLSRLRVAPQDIEDLLQETFVRGFAAEIKGDISETRAYLFRIAKNVALERQRRAAYVHTEAIEDSGSQDLILDEGQAAPEDWLDGQRKLALFAHALARLSPRCRTAFIMRRMEGLNYRQIATRMNISVSAVEKHVASGLLSCSIYLREHGYQPPSPGSLSPTGDGKRKRAGVARELADRRDE
ncbi:MAG: RNA polymerase sigma factor [Steroidobacteraceae bacterium]|nr:RNA polymerase sigma factor [Steroidobacteraceae bacterium]